MPEPPPVTTAILPEPARRPPSGTATSRPRPARREPLVGGRDAGERDALDLDRDGAGPRERHDLREPARVPQFEKITRSRADAAEAHRERPAGQPEQRDVPAGRDGAGRQGERVVAADAVDDQRGAAAARRPPQLAGARPAACSTTSAPLRVALECLVAAVDGDHARRAERLELDGDVTEPADADHDRARPRPQHVQRAADGVIRRQPRVGQRRRGDRVEPVERNGEAGEGTTTYSASPPSRPSPAPRAAAVARRDARPRRCRQGSGRIPTARRRGPARPARDRRPRAERGDGAGDLVAERERQLVRQHSGAPVHQVQIGMAEAGAGDANEYLTWTRPQARDVDQPSGSLPSGEPNRLHRQDHII